MYYVFLPVYNEEKAIRKVIQRIYDIFSDLTEPLHILVVDDGSSDGSGEILDSFQNRSDFTLLRHETNRGIDVVFRTGMEYLVKKAHDEDVMILLEADDTNDLKSLPPLMESLQNANDIVIASRFVQGGRLIGFPLWRRIPCTVINWMLRFVFSVENVTDYTIFFRGYSMKILKQGLEKYKGKLIETVGFVANAEILLKLSVFKPRIHEVPLLYQYNLKESRSKLRIPFTIRQYLILIANYLRRRRTL